MESKLQALKVPDLKKLLQDANLPVSGTKAELIKRLLENPASTESLGGGEEEDLLGEIDSEPPGKEEPKSATPAATTVSTQASTSTPTAAAPEAVKPSKAATASPHPAVKTSDAPALPEEDAEERKAALIAELEKRKARAARWGLPTGDAEAKLERAIKFGVEPNADHALGTLDGGLKGGKKREGKVAGGAEAAAKTTPKAAKEPPAPKVVETDEQKADRLARQEADEAAKKRRAERFGIQNKASAKETAAAPTAVVDPAEEERKRKRLEKFGTAPVAESAEKRVKT